MRPRFPFSQQITSSSTTPLMRDGFTEQYKSIDTTLFREHKRESGGIYSFFTHINQGACIACSDGAEQKSVNVQ